MTVDILKAQNVILMMSYLPPTHNEHQLGCLLPLEASMGEHLSTLYASI
jgi:hypothetical protein